MARVSQTESEQLRREHQRHGEALAHRGAIGGDQARVDSHEGCGSKAHPRSDGATSEDRRERDGGRGRNHSGHADRRRTGIEDGLPQSLVGRVHRRERGCGRVLACEHAGRGDVPGAGPDRPAQQLIGDGVETRRHVVEHHQHVDDTEDDPHHHDTGHTRGPGAAGPRRCRRSASSHASDDAWVAEQRGRGHHLDEGHELRCLDSAVEVRADVARRLGLAKDVLSDVRPRGRESPDWLC